MSDHVEDDTPSSEEVQVSVSALSPRGVTSTDQQKYKEEQSGPASLRGGPSSTNGSSSCSSPTTTTTFNPTKRRPNSSLTPSERQEKARLKRLLKLQVRIHKIEKRIRHAQSRRDPTTEEQAGVDLVATVEKHGEDGRGFVSDEFACLFGGNGDGKSCDRWCNNYTNDGIAGARTGSDVPAARTGHDIEQEVKQIVISVSNELFRHVYGDSDSSTDKSPSSTEKTGKGTGKGSKRKHMEETKGEDTIVTTFGSKIEAKEEQAKKAVRMMRAMTKGRQEENMFQDSTALWGYTRQKFVERAMLLCTSFLKLHPASAVPSNNCTGLTQEQRHVKDRIWNAISNISTVCSFGCGPGNDVLGFLALQACLNGNKRATRRVILLDWMIDEWEEAIISTLRPILERADLIDTKALVCVKCNVLKQIKDEENASTASRLSRESGEEIPSLYITSYLLSETRGRWHGFYLNLVERAASGSLFYFCEPKPWQLHELRRITGDHLDSIWVDSSMYYPTLQPNEGRTGPAVLVCVKK